MCRSVLLFIQIVLFLQAMPQDPETPVKRPANNISLHLLGNGAIAAVYYEHLFQLSPALILTASAGPGISPVIDLFGPDSGPDFNLISHLTTCIGRRKGLFEIGLGTTFVLGSEDPHTFFYPIAGFRLQPFKSDKMNFRIFGSYPFAGTDDWPFAPVGLSFGVVL